MKIDTSNWKRFKISDLFEVKGGTGIDFGHTSPGDINFVGRTTINNGIQGKVSYTGNKIFEGNCITISQVGTMVALWQMERFVTSQNITVIRNDKCNKMSGLFICTIINKIIKNSNFDYSATIKRSDINNMELPLPVTSDGSPDWQYMESYMQNLWDKIEITFKKENNNNRIDTSKWKKFKISDLFEVEKGRITSTKDLADGEIPFISCTTTNNGISAYKNINAKWENRITIAADGAPGYAFWHEYKFNALSNVNILLEKNFKLNKYIALFLCSIMTKLFIGKYSYDNKLGKAKLEAEEILLPVTSDGTPDWKYMEDFMRDIESRSVLIQAIKERVM